MSSYGAQRLLIGLPSLLICFLLIFMDATGQIDITKFGYAALGTWIGLILNFYFRKAGKENTNRKETG